MSEPVKLPAILIWWLSQEDCEAIGDSDERVEGGEDETSRPTQRCASWPTWLQSEYRSRIGRAGRGRLWCAPQFRDVSVVEDHRGWSTPIGQLCLTRGGIVITEAELPLLAELPGLVTSLDLRRWSSVTQGDEMVSVSVSFCGGRYSTTRRAYEAECRAKREGAAARAAGVAFHDNPYRKGPPAPTDWLCSSWEYGYSNGAGPEALGRIVE